MSFVKSQDEDFREYIIEKVWVEKRDTGKLYRLSYAGGWCKLIKARRGNKPKVGDIVRVYGNLHNRGLDIAGKLCRYSYPSDMRFAYTLGLEMEELGLKNEFIANLCDIVNTSVDDPDLNLLIHSTSEQRFQAIDITMKNANKK